MKVWIFECREPSYTAYKLGVAAAILLALAHIIANVLGGCVCVWSKDAYTNASANKQLAIASLIFSWYVFCISIIFIIRLQSTCYILSL